MALFIKTEDFKKLNIGCALDEGIASSDDTFLLYNGERSIWRKFMIIELFVTYK